MNIQVSIPEDFGDELVQSMVKVQGKLMEEAKPIINQALLAIETRAKEYAPVDTGRLRSSIHAVPVGTTDMSFVYGDETGRQFDGSLQSAVGNAGSNIGMVGTNVGYAAAQEFGGEGRPAHKYLTTATLEIQSMLVNELKKINIK